MTLFGELGMDEIDDYKNGMRLLDDQGASIPFQIEQYRDGPSRSLHVAFIAHGVPSVGYKAYYLVPAKGLDKSSNASEVKLDTDNTARQANDALGSDVLENEYYRVSVERATGRIDIFDKDLNQTVSQGIEVAAAEERGGDDQNIILPSGRTIIHVIDSVELEENGPSQTVLRIDGQVGGVAIVQRLSLYRGIKKIDIEDTIDWKPGRSMNIEQIFPVLQRDAEIRNGIPFGTAAASDIMAKAGPSNGDEVSPDIWKGWRQIQDWVFAGNKEWGFTVSADHNLIEVSDSAIRADMIRGTIFSPVTTFEDGHPIPDARPPADKYVFRYSFTSGKGDWSTAKSWRAGMAFSAPLIAVTSMNSLSAKPLPPEKSFLSLDADNLVLTAMKKADGGPAIVLRAFEIQGAAAESRILLLGQQATFRPANLLEEDTPAGEQKTLHVQPYQIDTLNLTIPSIGP